MAQPKRGLFSLNVDSTVSHIRERIEDEATPSGTRKVKVRDYTEPRRDTASFEVLTQPFEKEIQRSVERIIDGRVVRDTTTSRSDSSSTSDKTDERHKSLDTKYDTSDL